MKFENGMAVALDEIEYTSQFLSKEESDVYFSDLKQRTWSATNLPRMIIQYERYSDDTIEELVDLVEETFETFVNGVFLNLYRTGLDYAPYHRDTYDACHVFTLSFGCDRKFRMKNVGLGTVKEWTLSHGDLFYFSPQVNARCKHSLIRQPSIVKERISVVFFTERPYIRRERETRTIHVEGIDPDVDIWVDPQEKVNKKDLKEFVSQDAVIIDTIERVRQPDITSLQEILEMAERDLFGSWESSTPSSWDFSSPGISIEDDE